MKFRRYVKLLKVEIKKESRRRVEKYPFSDR